jgi:steroid 5-alpha reductase family enzyme
MLRTIILLLATLIIIPFVAYSAGLVPDEAQWAALKNLGWIMGGFALYCFIVSELSKNYSQTDKLWSITPIVYSWYVVVESGWDDRVVLMALLATVWGVRLTYNFGRRGGYSWIPWKGEEDYRWSVLQNLPLFKGHPWRYTAFNFFFISFYQHALILLFTLPIVAAWQGSSTPLNWLDYLAAALMLGMVVIEYIADQQQYDFQTEKYRRKHAGEALEGEYAQGFRSSGLWGLVRHPNYAAEQGTWIAFYLFSVAATGQWLNWSLIGAVLLVLLFLGSSDFSERITAGKYPAYKDYQKAVPRFIPWPGKSSPEPQAVEEEVGR